jgi:hypothetical protein
MGSKWKSHTCCSSIARGTTWPWLRTRYSRTWNSRGSKSILRPQRLTARDTKVEFEIPDTQHHFFDDTIAAPGESLNTGQQFREGERLDEVVITAGAQPAHPIINLAERTDNQGGRDDPFFPQAADDSDSIDARKHAIDRHHGIFGRASAARSVVAVDSKIDALAASDSTICSTVSQSSSMTRMRHRPPAIMLCLQIVARGHWADQLVNKIGKLKTDFFCQKPSH